MKMPSAGKVSACRGMFSFDPDEVGTTGLKPSQALPRQLPQGGSQAVKLVAKVLSVMRKFLAVLLALPLGELDAKRPERAGNHIK